MKNVYFITVCMLIISGTFFSQKVSIDDINSDQFNYWQISPRIGYDFPNYDEDFPNIGYDGGLEFGASVNKYWTNWGFQFDFDYLKNSPKAENIINPLYMGFINNNGILTGVSGNLFVRKNDVKRMYFGIGPAYKYQSPSNRFTIDFAFTAGMGKVDNGEILIYGETDSPNGNALSVPIAYHSGYDGNWVFSIKPGMRFNYFFNKNKTVGLHAGVYYLRHFGVDEGGNNDLIRDYVNNTLGGSLDGRTTIYYLQNDPLTEMTDGDGGNTVTYYGFEGLNETRGETTDPEAGEFSGGRNSLDVGSFGIYGGLTFRLFPKEKVDKTDCGHGLVYCSDHQDCHEPPVCCNTCPKGCKLTITAKDQLSGKIIPNTSVQLVNGTGTAVNSGVTDAYGVVVFQDVNQGTYTIKGKYEEVEFQQAAVSNSDFDDCLAQGGDGVIEKEILYTDERFVLQGKVVECNKNNPIQGVDVMAKNTTVAEQLNTISDSNGKFSIHVNQATTYAIQGKKSGYFSNIQMVNVNDYNRNKDFEIKMQMCVDPCGQAIKLDNIHFDTAKWDIKPESIPDLRYILNLMDENPNIIVEMSSHTDWRGSTSYNQDLSQKRANSTVDWLVANGADRSRLRARGAGESEPVNNCIEGCQNAAELEANRRTEFKVECPN